MHILCSFHLTLRALHLHADDGLDVFVLLVVHRLQLGQLRQTTAFDLLLQIRHFPFQYINLALFSRHHSIDVIKGLLFTPVRVELFQ